MLMLAIGLLLFCGAHLYTSLGRDHRTGLLARLGENGYKSAYSIVTLAGLILIVMGWRATDQVMVYTPPFGLRMLTVLMMLISIILFVASQAPTNIRRMIRHPQLSAIILWSAAHLLANGDNLGVILFGTLGLWAAVEIIAINRREGEWVKRDKVPVSRDVVTVIIGIIVFVLLLKGHVYFTGLSLTG